MASMCGSTISYPALNTGSYYRPGAYPYQNDYYLPPRSTWSRVSPQQTKKQRGSTTWKVGSAMLIISAMLVLIAVFAIAGLALWMGALRTDSKNAIAGFSCTFRVAKGEKYNPMLKLNTSMVFREKERKYKNIFELLFRRSVLSTAYQKTVIDKFESGILKVFFRVYLDRRKVPRSITNVEDTIEDIIAKETYSTSSLFKDMELDLTSISVKRLNQDAAGNQKQTQQRNAMITKNGLLRPSRNNTLITSPKSKTKPSKPESSEPDIDFSNIPTIQGTYKASKVNNTSSNRTDSTQDSDKPLSDPKDANGSLPEEQTTIRSSSTEETVRPVSSVVQTTALRIKEKSNHTIHNERTNETTQGTTKRVASTSTVSTTRAKVEDLFKDFRKPDLETSPWKPILPGYVNTELKLLPGSAGKTNHKVNYSTASPGEAVPESTTRIPQYTVQARIPESSTQRAKPSEPPETVNMYVDVPGMSTFDTEDTDFPHDRIVPQEMVNFRVNGKFKNKIPGLMADGQIFTAPPPLKLEEGVKPIIEVSGQLPSETYDIRLRTSSGPGETESSFTKPYRSTNENETGWRVPGSQVSYRVTEGDSTKVNEKADDSGSDTKDKESSDNFLLSVSPSTQRWHVQRPTNFSSKEESTTKASMIGVAEPVPDTDVELEARNRYSDVQAVTEHHSDAPRDREADKKGQEPVYTSYKTPDLNGAGLKHSLIENSGTLKPFRHTIPVDKLTSVLDYGGDGEGNSSLTPGVNSVTDSAINDGGKFNEDAELSGEVRDEGSSLERNSTEPEGSKVLSGSLKEVAQVETFYENSNSSSKVSAPMKHGKIELSERARPTESSTQSIIDDDKLLKLSTTEVYSEMIHPLHNNVDKLVMQDEGGKQKPPGRLTPNISRNSTFIEIDTLKHTPGQAQGASSFESEPSFNTEEELDWIFNGTVSRPSSSPEIRKKVYNDTLKAYVVENLVTLAPAKSNTGVGRPVRPRPKIDREEEAQVIEKSSNRSSPDDITLLEQLFGVRSRDRHVTKQDSSDDRDHLLRSSESNEDQPRIEQIVEVVTSISTKVSSNIKDDPIVLKLTVTNSTSLPVIHLDSREEETTTQVSVLEESSLDVDREEESFLQRSSETGSGSK